VTTAIYTKELTDPERGLLVARLATVGHGSRERVRADPGPGWLFQAHSAWGLVKRVVEAGDVNSFAAGRVGRSTKSPPQLGQMPPNRVSAQSAQNVHSNVQIRASGDPFGRSRSQHSQFGRSVSTRWPRAETRGSWAPVAPCSRGDVDPSVFEYVLAFLGGLGAEDALEQV